MAYIPGFKHDIFLSYAHKDNKALGKDSEDWVKVFRNRLKDELDRALEGDVEIWMDKTKLTGLDDFNSKIKADLNQSAVCLCLNSPKYRESEWCDLERELFFKKIQNEGGLKVGHSNRIVNVLLRAISHNVWPDEFGTQSGYIFYQQDNEADDLNETNTSPIETSSEEFTSEIKKLRADLCPLLQDLKERNDDSVSHNENDKINDSRLKIYLANIPESLEHKRGPILKLFENSDDYLIIETDLNGLNEKDFGENVIEDLRDVDLTIHLLDKNLGIKFEDNPGNSYRKKQLELALEGNAPIKIWMSKDNKNEDIDDPNYKALIDKLNPVKPSNKTDFGHEFIRGLEAQMVDVLEDTVKVHFDKKRNEIKLQELQNKEELDILFDFNNCEEAYASELKNLFESRNDFIIHQTPSLSKDENKNRSHLYNYMEKARKLIFVWGDTTKERIFNRLNFAIKKISQESPVDEVFLLIAPPPREDDGFWPLGDEVPFEVINKSTDSDLDPDQFEHFLNTLDNSATDSNA